ncbi:MAG: ABC transporter substrate-binding protein [Fervidicoccaceae archaeon]
MKKIYITLAIALAIISLIASFLYTEAGEIQVGGTLTIAMVSEPTQITASSSWNGAFVAAQIFDTLLRFDNNLNLVPGLAESYYVNTTCGCYVFKLRTNATWHDGQPVTADDVKFTFENIVPKYASYGDPYFTNTTVTIVNSTTVIIKPGIFSPAAQLPLFADPSNTPILPKHILEGQDFMKSTFLTNPVGSGPYKLNAWVKGSYIELVRNDKYWDDSKPYLSKIIIRFISDPSTIVAGLKKGEINYVFRGLPYETIQDLKTVRGLNVTVSLRPPYLAALWINCNDTILSNPLVRQAIAYAINRTDIAAKATLGNAPVVDYVIDPDLVPPPSGLIHYERNLTLASKLLDEAGYPVSSNGTRFTIELLTRNLPETQTIAQVLKEQLADVGINLNIKIVDLPTFLQLQSTYKYQLALIGYWISPIWAYQLFHSKYIGKGAFSNPFYLNSTEVDAYLDDWLHQSDPQKQIYDMQQVELYVNRNIVEIPLYKFVWINVIDKNFAGTDLPLGKWLVYDPIINTYYLPLQTTTQTTATTTPSPTATTTTTTVTTTPQNTTTSPATTAGGIGGLALAAVIAVVAAVAVAAAFLLRKKK